MTIRFNNGAGPTKSAVRPPTLVRESLLAPYRPMAAMLVCLLAACATGCSDAGKGPMVFFLDGAGWYSSSGSVENGLRQAGYTGRFRTHTWSAFLGPAQDHFVTARSKGVGKALANRIEKVRKADPEARIVVIGLSAGTAVVLSALEQLPPGVQVDYAVLLSPSVSAEHDLTKAMDHVRRRLYATSSSRDALLATLAVNADGKSGPPAGESGFRVARRGEKTEAAYSRVVNIRWQPRYMAFDWEGGHTSVTHSGVVAALIAPRVLSDEPYPLDRPVAQSAAVASRGE
jgi:pimeloyl-ACP methyl ester carboxylesterase